MVIRSERAGVQAQSAGEPERFQLDLGDRPQVAGEHRLDDPDGAGQSGDGRLGASGDVRGVFQLPAGSLLEGFARQVVAGSRVLPSTTRSGTGGMA